MFFSIPTLILAGGYRPLVNQGSLVRSDIHGCSFLVHVYFARSTNGYFMKVSLRDVLEIVGGGNTGLCFSSLSYCCVWLYGGLFCVCFCHLFLFFDVLYVTEEKLLHTKWKNAKKGKELP